jgi:hypothetical protein
MTAQKFCALLNANEPTARGNMSITLRSAATLAWLALSACATPSTSNGSVGATDTSSITDQAFFKEQMAHLFMNLSQDGDNTDRVDVYFSAFGYGSIAISALHESFYSEEELVELTNIYVSMRLTQNNQHQALKNGNKVTATVEIFDASISMHEFEELISHLDRNDFYSRPDSNVSDENAPTRDGAEIICLDGGGYMLNLQVKKRHKLISRNMCYSKYSDASSYAAPLFELARETFPEIAGQLSKVESMLNSEG